MKLEVMTMIGIATFAGGVYAWDANRRDNINESIHIQLAEEVNRKAKQEELARVELEIKVLNEASTRRDLTVDEDDRLIYLKQVRVMLKEQLGQIDNA